MHRERIRATAVQDSPICTPRICANQVGSAKPAPGVTATTAVNAASKMEGKLAGSFSFDQL